MCPLNFFIGRLVMEILCCELSLARHTTTLAAMLSCTRRTLSYPILPQPPLRNASGRLSILRMLFFPVLVRIEWSWTGHPLPIDSQ